MSTAATSNNIQLELETMEGDMREPLSRKRILISGATEKIENVPGEEVKEIPPEEVSSVPDSSAAGRRSEDLGLQGGASSISSSSLGPMTTTPSLEKILKGGTATDLNPPLSASPSSELTTEQPMTSQIPPIQKEKSAPFPTKEPSRNIAPPSIVTGELPKKSEEGLNRSLIYVLVALVILTLIAGIYYYTSVVKSSKETEKAPSATTDDIKKTPDTQTKTPATSTAPDTKIPEVEEPVEVPTVSILDSAATTPVDLTNVKEDLKKIIETIENDAEKATALKEGLILRLVKNGGDKVNTREFFEAIGIQLPDLFLYVKEDFWLFVSKNSLNNSIDTSIILSLTETRQKEEAFVFVKSVESELPAQFANIFVGEKPVLTSEGKSLFKGSEINKDVRYYNYTPGDPTKSTDWGIIKDGRNNRLFFSTSKDATGKVLRKFEK